MYILKCDAQRLHPRSLGEQLAARLLRLGLVLGQVLGLELVKACLVDRLSVQLHESLVDGRQVDRRTALPLACNLGDELVIPRRRQHALVGLQLATPGIVPLARPTVVTVHAHGARDEVRLVAAAWPGEDVRVCFGAPAARWARYVGGNLTRAVEFAVIEVNGPLAAWIAIGRRQSVLAQAILPPPIATLKCSSGRANPARGQTKPTR